MNVPSTTPPVAGSAVNGVAPTGAGAAPSATNGGGIADLFSALLASLQASLVNTPAVPTADGSPEGESPDAATVPAGDVETSDTGPIIVSDGEVPPESTGEDGDANAPNTDVASTPFAGTFAGTPLAVPNQEPGVLQAVAETAVEDAGDGSEANTVRAQPVTQVAPQKVVPQAAVGVTPVAQEVATDSATSAVSVEPEAELEPIVPPKSGQSAPPLVPREQGVFVAEAVRQGQLQAAQIELGPERTIRRLIQDAIESARARAGSAELESNSEGDALVSIEPVADDAAGTPLFAKRAGLDVIPELRPGFASGSGATGTAHPAAPGIAAGLVAGDAPLSGEITPQARASTRAALPQSVDVRDVGDFTVRSVRYLSGRGEETVTVRLVPRSLGELHLAVRSAADGLEIVLTAASHAARERLEVQIVGLREMLAREGVDVSRVTVQAPPGYDLGSQMPSQHQHHQHHAGHGARHHAPAYREPEHNPPEQQFAGSGRPQHDGGLNMLA